MTALPPHRHEQACDARTPLEFLCQAVAHADGTVAVGQGIDGERAAGFELAGNLKAFQLGKYLTS